MPSFSSVQRPFHSVGRVQPQDICSRCRHTAVEALKPFIELVMRLAQKVRTTEEILRYKLSDLRELKTLYQMEIT